TGVTGSTNIISSFTTSMSILTGIPQQLRRYLIPIELDKVESSFFSDSLRFPCISMEDIRESIISPSTKERKEEGEEEEERGRGRERKRKREEEEERGVVMGECEGHNHSFSENLSGYESFNHIYDTTSELINILKLCSFQYPLSSLIPTPKNRSEKEEREESVIPSCEVQFDRIKLFFSKRTTVKCVLLCINEFTGPQNLEITFNLSSSSSSSSKGFNYSFNECVPFDCVSHDSKFRTPEEEEEAEKNGMTHPICGWFYLPVEIEEKVISCEIVQKRTIGHFSLPKISGLFIVRFPSHELKSRRNGHERRLEEEKEEEEREEEEEEKREEDFGIFEYSPVLDNPTDQAEHSVSKFRKEEEEKKKREDFDR
ncbi:hypothetical protein ADUPG1_007356, partial [Aduncisulcus paluster]